MDYAKAKQLAESAKDKAKGKPLENNTRAIMRGENVAVRLHQTDILTFSPDGAVTYNSGGWRTVTTKDRMNEYGPARIWSDRGTWHISVNGEGKVYAEGCKVKDGRIFGAAANDKKEKAIRSQVGVYVKEYMRRLNSGEIPAPSSGDCWGCCMRTDKGERPMGGKDHIISHIQEKYYVPSLVYAAVENMGGSIAEKHTVRALTVKDCEPWPGDFINKQIGRHLRKYMLRELGLAA